MTARDAFVRQAEALHAAILQDFLAPPLHRDCSGWADEFRRIVKGPEKGLWRTARTPYLREPMDCTDPENPVQRLVMQFATQLGKTEVLYNAVFKRIHLQPMDMLLVQPTLQDAKDHSRQRFLPTAKSMPEVMRRLPRSGSRDESNTWQTKEIQGGATLYFSGANSARSLASKPLPFAACDEIDGYPLDVDGEGDPLGLIWERMSNFPQRKLLLCSTPTITGTSRIEAEYLASDRRRFWVPCPHCGEFQVLAWGSKGGHGIQWQRTAAGEPRPETAVYVCMHCGAAIEDRQKAVMLPEGQWRAEAPGAQEGLVAGFHLSKLYSPPGWKSWAMLVDDWHKAQLAKKAGDTSRLKTFVNTSLAETFTVTGEKTDVEVLAERSKAEGYRLRLVPRHGLVLAAGVDIQDNRFEIVVWAAGRDEERWAIDYRVMYCDPGQWQSWLDLDVYLGTRFPHESGQTLAIDCTGIDTGGHFTHQVYRYAMLREARRVYATKGSSIDGQPIVAGTPKRQDVNADGQVIRDGVKLWQIGTGTAKDVIHSRLRVAQPGPGYMHMSHELPRSFFEQLTAEERLRQTTARGEVWRWVKPKSNARNEVLDCSVIAEFCFARMKLHQYTAAEWSRLELALWPPTADLFNAPAVPEPLPPPEPLPGQIPAPVQAKPEEGTEAPVEAAAAAIPSHWPASPPPSAMPAPALWAVPRGRTVRGGSR